MGVAQSICDCKEENYIVTMENEYRRIKKLDDGDGKNIILENAVFGAFNDAKTMAKKKKGLYLQNKEEKKKQKAIRIKQEKLETEHESIMDKFRNRGPKRNTMA
jgi:hypothetical protein